MEIAVLGIDLGKTTCSVAGLDGDGDGAVVLRKRIRRHRLLAFLSRLSPCVVAMEACGSAHHLGHFCVEQGHDRAPLLAGFAQFRGKPSRQLVRERVQLARTLRDLEPGLNSTRT